MPYQLQRYVQGRRPVLFASAGSRCQWRAPSCGCYLVCYLLEPTEKSGGCCHPLNEIGRRSLLVLHDVFHDALAWGAPPRRVLLQSTQVGTNTASPCACACAYLCQTCHAFRIHSPGTSDVCHTVGTATEICFVETSRDCLRLHPLGYLRGWPCC